MYTFEWFDDFEFLREAVVRIVTPWERKVGQATACGQGTVGGPTHSRCVRHLTLHPTGITKVDTSIAWACVTNTCLVIYFHSDNKYPRDFSHVKLIHPSMQLFSTKANPEKLLSLFVSFLCGCVSFFSQVSSQFIMITNLTLSITILTKHMITFYSFMSLVWPWPLIIYSLSIRMVPISPSMLLIFIFSVILFIQLIGSSQWKFT